MDERTRRYIGEIVKYNDVPSPCDREKYESIRDKVIDKGPSNFIPELSPDYNPKTGMIESDSIRPVRMFDLDSNSGMIAKKWIIKED